MKLSILNNGDHLFDVYDYGYKICTVELYVNGFYWLNKITLEDDCRGKEYGPVIIDLFKERYKPFRISLSSKHAHYYNNPDTSGRDTRCLTPDGFKLAKKCFCMGILNRENYAFPFREVLPEYEQDRFLDNKILNTLNLVNRLLRFPLSK